MKMFSKYTRILDRLYKSDTNVLSKDIGMSFAGGSLCISDTVDKYGLKRLELCNKDGDRVDLIISDDDIDNMCVMLKSARGQ